MEYYVAADAWRSGDGSKERPFQFICEAAAAAMPGDTITVTPGVYHETVNPPRGGTTEKRIVYRSEVPGGAVIEGKDHCFFATRNGIDFITVSGFVCRLSSGEKGERQQREEDVLSCGNGLVGCLDAAGWIIEDCEISGGAHAGIFFSGYCKKEKSYDLSDGKGKERLARIQTICSISADDTACGMGNHVVRRVRIHDCMGGGIVAGNGVAGSVFEDNHIHDMSDACGFFLHGAADVTIRRNRVDHVKTGIRLFEETQNVKISQNILYENETDLTVTGAHGPVMVDNTLLLSEKAAMLDNTACSFVHNLIAGALQAGDWYGESAFFFPHQMKIAGFSAALSGKLYLANNIFSPVKETAHTALTVLEVAEYGNIHAHKIKEQISLTVSETKDGKLLLDTDLYEDFPREGASLITAENVLSAHPLGDPYLTDDSQGAFSHDYYGTYRGDHPLPGPFEKPNPRFIVFDASLTGEQLRREALSETERNDAKRSLKSGIVLLGVQDITVKQGGKTFHPQEIFIDANTAWIHGTDTEHLTETDCVYGVTKTIQKWTMEAEDSVDTGENAAVHKIAECVAALMSVLTEGRKAVPDQTLSKLNEEATDALKEYGLSIRLTGGYLKFLQSREKKFLTLEDVVHTVSGRSVNYIAEVVEDK